MSNSVPTAPPTEPRAITAAAAEEHAAPSWLKRVALLTGVLAALGGYLTVRSTSLSNDAIYNSTQAVLMQAQASDKWEEFQADSIKAHEAQMQLNALGPGQPTETLIADVADHKGRQPSLMSDANALESNRDDLLKNGKKLLGEKDTLGYAGMAGQLAIALASVAALTRRKDAFIVAIVCGAFAFAVTGYAIVVNHFLTHG